MDHPSNEKSLGLAGKVMVAVRQWRDSLVNLTARNRLLHYRPTRSSTIEFSRHSAAELHRIVASPELTYTVGTRPPEMLPAGDLDDDQVSSDDLEQAVLSQLQDFDFEKFPDHLFADKSQRDVDRALRTLAGIAKREFIDKGLRTLYLAMGELCWTEDSGDRRRSPLLLFPAELGSLGPRERIHLSLSDDDIAVNPALALRLASDFGLSLPSAEDIFSLLEAEGIEPALDLFRAIDWPSGWEVRDFAVLGVFMFAKEAMYRDLLENESQIVASPAIQALSGAIQPDSSPFAFEEYGDQNIDDIAPPESAPLVLDADASQRAAVQAAIEGRSFTLDGPPGTGKSQTIANIIGGLIESGKSVLFVSEKAVALDVVRDRLTERGLDPFLFELHSSKASRKDVAVRLGQALAMQPLPPREMPQLRIEQLREARTALTGYALAANQIRSPMEASFHQVLGSMEQVRSPHVGPSFTEDAQALSPEVMAQIERCIAILSTRWAMHVQGNKAPWFGLIHRGDLRFTLHSLKTTLTGLEQFLDETKETRIAFGLGTLGDFTRVAVILALWHSEPTHHADADLWLAHADSDAVFAAVKEYVGATVELDRREGELTSALGESWNELRAFTTEQIPLLDEELCSLPGVSATSDPLSIRSARDSLLAAASNIESLSIRTEHLARLAGAQAPQSVESVVSLLKAVTICVSEDAPNVMWLYEEETRLEAARAFETARSAQAALEAAERVADAVFTPAVLTVDLAELEQWVDTTSGFFGRFSADHRSMRRTLASISPEKWKVAFRSLPLARQWVDSHDVYTTAAKESTRLLKPHFKPDRTTDWDRLGRCLKNAEVGSTANFRVRSSTEYLLENNAAKAEARDTLYSVEALLSTWQDEYQMWADSPDSEDVSFGALKTRIADRVERLELLVEIVAAFQERLGRDATLGEYLNAAECRASFDRAAATAEIARASVALIAGSTSVGTPASSADAQSALERCQWARSIFVSASRDGGFLGPINPQQIAALRVSKGIPGGLDVFETYETLRDEVVSWFNQDRQLELAQDLLDYSSAVELISVLNTHVEAIDDWFELESALSSAMKLGIHDAAKHAQREAMPAKEVANYLMSTVYKAWLDIQLRDDLSLSASIAADRDALVKRFRELDEELADSAVAKIIRAGVSRRPKSMHGQAGIIRREAEKKRKHIPVRELIDSAREVILALHPCFMMSPLAVSQYLPAEQLFDVVIFDEASQVLPADAINCVYRGAAVIAAGDQKQLPPTSFFEPTVDELDEDSEEDVATDFESILDLMKSTGVFTAQSLRWHYRSRHEHLIAYSNASFYDSRLITFPGALTESDDAGVRFFKVPGIYRRSAGRDNPIEAQHVAERVIHHFTSRPGKSMGVVAFSTAQRDAIESAVELARASRPDLDGHFSEDRAHGFFVKSLESVQGDERDVIIFSIGYGPDEKGKVYRQFGPVSRNGGERRLNVAITRAKELVEVVSSIGAADIGEVGSSGGRHLRRYLDFAERGPAALELELGPAGMDTESPFEDAVVAYVRSCGFEVQPQVGVAGYRIDIGVKHPNQPGAFMLGIECDGAMYHSSRTARDRDRLRHQILEGLGWHLHHIWGTAWYRHPDREKERLRALLEDFASRPVTGRLSSPPPKAVMTLELVDRALEEAPPWVEDYKVADTSGLRHDVLEYSSRLHELLDVVVKAEGPVHFAVMLQRIRDHDLVERIGARMRKQILLVISRSKYEFDGEFLWASASRTVAVRRGTEQFTRTLDQIPDEELSQAATNLVTDAVGITQRDLVTRVGNIFGWKRTGADIRVRIDGIVDGLVAERFLSVSGDGIRLGPKPRA